MTESPAVLSQKKTMLIEQIKRISETAKRENRELKAEEKEAFDSLRSQVDAIGQDLSRHDYIAALETQEQASILTPESDKADIEFARRCRGFSITRAVGGVLQRAGVTQGARDDGSEREISQELARRSGRSYEGIAVPMDALSQRVVSTTTPGGGPGSNIIDDDYRPGDFIELLRDALVLNRLGVRTIRGLMGDVQIPRQTAGGTPAWAAEQGDLALDQNLQFDQITMSPHKVGIIGEFTQQMILQASPDIEMLFRQDFAAALARRVDTVALFGGGSNEPSGVVNEKTNVARANDTNGKILTYPEIMALRLMVNNANVGMNARRFITNYNVENFLIQTHRVTNQDSPIMMDGRIHNAEPVVVSNLIPSNQTHGTGTNTKTYLLYGNWSDLIVGYWQDLDLLVNPYANTQYQRGSVLLRGMMHLDVVLRYDAAFEYYDAITYDVAT